MLKTAKRKRDGQVVELDSTPADATLRPCFTPPCTPQKRRYPSMMRADDAASIAYMDVAKRRHMTHCGIAPCFPRSRIETAAAVAADTAAVAVPNDVPAVVGADEGDKAAEPAAQSNIVANTRQSNFFMANFLPDRFRLHYTTPPPRGQEDLAMRTP